MQLPRRLGSLLMMLPDLFGTVCVWVVRHRGCCRKKQRKHHPVDRSSSAAHLVPSLSSLAEATITSQTCDCSTGSVANSVRAKPRIGHYFGGKIAHRPLGGRFSKLASRCVS